MYTINLFKMKEIYCLGEFMSLTSNELKSIAELAYLDIEDTQAVKLGEDVNAIIDFVQELSKIDTHGVTPLFHPLDLFQPLRADEVSEESCLEELAQIAPHFEEGLYWVPNVMSREKE